MPLNNATRNAPPFDHTVGSGKYRKLGLFVAYNDANRDILTGATYGGEAMTYVGRGENDRGTSYNVCAYYELDSPPTGTAEVAVSSSGSPNEGFACVAFDLYEVGPRLDWDVDWASADVSITINGAFGVIGAYSFDDLTAGYGTDVDAMTSIGTHNFASIVTGVNSNGSSTVTLALTGMTNPAAIAVSYDDPPALDQEGFAWGDDDGNQASHTIGTQDANYSGATGTKILRTILNASGDAPETTFSLYYQQDGSGGYTAVPVGASTADALEVACWEEADSGNATTSSLGISKPGAGSSNGDNPSDPETGDVLIILCGSDDNTNTAQWDDSTLKPTGFTLIKEIGNSTQDCHAAAFYRVVDGTEGSSFTIPAQSSDNMWAVCALVKNGAGTPLNVTGADSTDSTPTPFSIAAVSTTTNDCLAFFVAAFDGGDDGGFTVGGTGWEKRSEVRDGTGSGNAAGVWGTKPMASSGGTLSPTVTPNVSDGMVGFTFAIAMTLGTVDNDVYIDTSSNITDGEATTARLTAPTGKSGNFTAGTAHDASNGGAVDITEDYYTEMLHVISIASGVTGYVDFRLYADGEALASYTVTPRWTIAAMVYTLTADAGSFTVSGQTAALLATRNLSAAAGGYTLTGQAAALLTSRMLTAAAGSYSLSGNDAGLLTSRLLTANAGSYSLTGNNAGLLISRLIAADAGAYTLTGQDATLLQRFALAAGVGAFDLTGNAVGLLASRLLSAGAGSYTLTGNAADLLISRLLSAGGGSFTLTGNAADLVINRLLTAGAGSYTLSGNDASLLVSRLLAAGGGSFTLTGQTAALLVSRLLSGEAGAFVLTGIDATLTYDTNTADYTLSADGGSYTLSGQAAGLLVGRLLAAGQGSYTVNGQDVTLLVSRLLSAESGAYTYTGNDAGLLANRSLTANSGAYSLSGNDAVMLANRLLSGEAGAFVLSGQNVTFVYDGAVVAVYTADAFVNLTPTANLTANLSPAAGLAANMTPGANLETNITPLANGAANPTPTGEVYNG
ncbi:hypothetical protein KC887_01150 [Candidatus Kaiserbacteria bacterium]|nr:hypothetical protein [Candidatus Kaiserbacteria bacterium]